MSNTSRALRHRTVLLNGNATEFHLPFVCAIWQHSGSFRGRTDVQENERRRSQEGPPNDGRAQSAASERGAYNQAPSGRQCRSTQARHEESCQRGNEGTPGYGKGSVSLSSRCSRMSLNKSPLGFLIPTFILQKNTGPINTQWTSCLASNGESVFIGVRCIFFAHSNCAVDSPAKLR